MNMEIHMKKKLGEFTLDVNLSSDNNRIGILGASGCGKSMTLKSIAGIETPEEGYIRIGDRVLFDSEKKVNLKPQERRVGYLFQNYALFPTMTVLKNIEAGLKGSKEANRARALQMVEKFALQGLEERLPGQLSGGQQQRVALARIMAYEPDVILLDEPFSALDVFLKDKLQQELLGMLEDYEGLVIMVSHSRDEIYNFGQELLIMDQGHEVIHGDTKEIFRNPCYIPAAVLTGCKNICKAERIDAHHLHCIEWNLDLTLSKEIPENLVGVGIRAHNLEPRWEKPEKNGFAFQVKSAAEFPFEYHYYLQSGEGEIAYYLYRDRYAKLQEKGQPLYLEIPENAVLLLQE